MLDFNYDKHELYHVFSYFKIKENPEIDQVPFKHDKHEPDFE